MSDLDGGQRGFEEFVAARRGALLRTAYLLTGSHHDAEDLVQTTLLRVVPKWGRISTSPEAYVRKVLARESVTRWRGRRWRERSTAHLPEPTATEPTDDRMALRDALATLSPRQRAVLVLRYYDDLTEPATAEVLGISVGTVKSHARDGLARLRELAPHLLTEGEDAVAVGQD
ncbi:SigE family RNA polymerase sigma factor [Nocardioides cynanchi]|uniref:SigE family RNA polymerase sigma factor n=1 Tax=Nocardioides cynanchi TaxID=2558918 RepID=UPI001246FCCA|nr:SigE family RNA polymerase sigma factor [Nocardioides cynanchi]